MKDVKQVCLMDIENSLHLLPHIFKFPFKSPALRLYTCYCALLEIGPHSYSKHST